MKIAITIVALLVIGAVVGLLIDFGSVFLGIPLALMFIGLVVTKEGLDRQLRIMQMKRFRTSVRAQRLDSTPEDKRTMI
jgi:hypothetical protein